MALDLSSAIVLAFSSALIRSIWAQDRNVAVKQAVQATQGLEVDDEDIQCVFDKFEKQISSVPREVPPSDEATAVRVLLFSSARIVSLLLEQCAKDTVGLMLHRSSAGRLCHRCGPALQQLF